MSNEPIYAWVQSQVKEVHPDVCMTYAYEGCVLFDPFDLPEMQWGRVTKGRWEELRIDEVPPEFRAHLLLLGVS